MIFRKLVGLGICFLVSLVNIIGRLGRRGLLSIFWIGIVLMVVVDWLEIRISMRSLFMIGMGS